MKITKYIHSCILIETDDKSILIDPGIYTFQEKALSIEQITKLDYLLVTHEHPDHMYIPLIFEAMQKFPDAKLITNESAAKMLQEHRMNPTTESDACVSIEVASHEKVLGTIPPNVLFHINAKVTHPGDSHSFTETKPVLLLPLQAPWGSMVDAVELAVKLKPKYVIPIHDWHWREEARVGLYEAAYKHLQVHGIELLKPETGQPIEINL